MAGKKRTETVYAVCWRDATCFLCDAGVYRVFRERGRALDYATDTVFERAGDLERKVLNSEDCWETEMTREQVRDRLGSGQSVAIPIEFNEYISGTKNLDEFVEVFVMETELEVE